MKRAAILACAAIAAAAAFYLSLPQAARTLSASSSRDVRGVIHVHTRRSDGSGTPEEVAAAAAKAGLKFVILTDHGDGTRTPADPMYRNGVLLVDALEVSGTGGHVVVLGLSKTEYPLGGEVRDIVDDVARLGGMAIAAHPDSAKRELRWTEWSSPFGGIEWLNLDSESREERVPTLARSLLTYPFEPTGALARMLDRPDTVLRRWDALSARRRVVAFAGADAHARVNLRSDESRAGLGSVRIPSYESTFRAFSITAVDVAFTGDAVQDARVLLEALRRGRLYSTVDAIATPGAVSFRAVRGGETWHSGDFVPPGGDIELQVDSNAPPGSRIVLLKDGKAEVEVSGQMLRRTVRGSDAVYRVEILAENAPGKPPVPWVVTNPIYVRTQDAAPPGRGDAKERSPLYDDGDAKDWRLETSPRSKAALNVVRSVTGREVLVRWGLGGALRESPYAALAVPAGAAVAAYDRLTFTGRAAQPMRLSVQLRSTGGDRWRRSIYLDDQPRPITVFFDELRPAGEGLPARVPLGAIQDLLFVVDTVNTKMGVAGQFWIDDLQYGR